jgi:hypothetical protein
MARGGKRQGAGRAKGSESYATKIKKQAVKEAVAAAQAEGETPLEYMLRVMRDVGAEPKRRDAMALGAASFIHPRLSNTTVNTNVKRSVDEFTTDELWAALQQGRDREGTDPAERGDTKPN